MARQIFVALASFVFCASIAFAPSSAAAGGALGLDPGALLGSAQAGEMARGSLDSTLSTINVGESATIDALLGNPAELQMLRSESALDQLASQLRIPKSALGSVLVEAAQRVDGVLVGFSATALTLRTQRGEKTFLMASDDAAAARTLVGQKITLRSADGIHATSLVGRRDVMRGTVVAISGDAVTFISALGEVHTITLGAASIASLAVRTGSDVAAISDDFDKTARFGVITAMPNAVLRDLFSGRVTAVSKNLITVQLAHGSGTFVADAATARLAGQLRGQTIAFIAPDGKHIKALVAGSMLDQLMATATGQARVNGGVLAEVMAASRNRLTLQLPNGDVVTYLLTTPLLQDRTRVAVTLVPLDFVHARIVFGAVVLKAVDAAACITVNSGCRNASLRGTVVAMSPTSATVRLGNGDLRTLIGDVHGLRANVGVPVTISPLDNVRARVAAGASAANLIDARACVTINSGCHAVAGSVLSVSADRATVALADGTKVELRGSTSGLFLTTNLPVIVQPLDDTHAVLQANGSALGFLNAGACVTVNSFCVASTNGGSPAPASAKAIGGVNRGSAPNAIDRSVNQNANDNSLLANASGGATNQSNAKGAACASLNSGACVASAGSGRAVNSPPDNGGVDNGGAGSSGPFIAGAPTTISASDVIAMAAATTPCSQDGQIGVAVTDAATHKPLLGTAVQLKGVVNAAWVTGKSGKLLLQHVPTGYYTLSLAHAGFVPVKTQQFRVDCVTMLDVIAQMTSLQQQRPAEPQPAALVKHVKHVAASSLRSNPGSMCVFQLPRSAGSSGTARSAAIQHVFCTR